MDRKRPLPVRIITAAVLIGFCFYCGIYNRKGIMLVSAAVIQVIAVYGARAVYINK